jgi:acyl transferase domain-containing protein
VEPTQTPAPALLVFSAQHAASVQGSIEKYQNYLLNNSVLLKDVAYTLGAHRVHMLYKAFGIANAPDNIPFEASPVTKSNSSPVLAFVFTGQGAQWPEMGKELIEDYDTFRADIRAMDAALKQLKQAPSWKIEGLF